jgi:glycosidase
VNKNYDGPRTPYGDAYTGYWVTDVSQLNPHFGTADDLKGLSAELHRRDMYLMVDLVLNNVMATSLTPNYSDYFFKVSFVSPLLYFDLDTVNVSRMPPNTIRIVLLNGAIGQVKCIVG